MSPPVPPTCLSCHGTPQTLVERSELDEMAASQTQPLDWPDCRMGERWRGQAWILERTREGWRNLPWWVRGNYETTRTHPLPEPDGGEDNADRRLPFRIRVDDAQLHAQLHPRFNEGAPLSHLLGANAPDEFWFSLATDPQAQVDLNLTVENDELLLRSQNLIRTQGVLLDGPGTWNIRDPQLSVDDEGMVHLEFNLPYEWWNFWNHGHHDLILNQDLRPQILGPLFDMLQGWGIPGTDPMEPDRVPLPESLGFEAVVEGLYNFIRHRPPRPREEEPLLARLLPHLLPGSQITSNTIRIDDVFYPGILDLGPSTLRAQLDITENGTARIGIGEVNLQLEPMGYGGDSEDEGPSVLLHSGSIRSSERPYDPELLGNPIPPGIQAEWLPQTQEVTIQGNLDLTLRITVPGLGEVEVTGNLAAELSLNLSGEGPLLNPGCTLWLNDLTLRQVETGRILLQQGEILLRNHHENVRPDEDPNVRNPRLSLFTRTQAEEIHHHLDFGPHWHLQVSGLGANGEPFGLDGQMTVPDPDTEIDPLSLMGYEQVFSGLFNFFHQGLPREGDVLSLALAMSVHNRESREENSDETLIGIQNFDLSTVDSENHPQITLRSVQGNLHRIQEGDEHETLGVYLMAQVFESVLSLRNRRQGLSLNNLTVETVADQVELTEGLSRISLPLFRVEANGEGWSRQGLVRGPIRLEQRDGHQVSVQWDRAQGALNLEVNDLAARINAQGIFVPEHLSEGMRNLLDPTVDSLGLDGYFEANFTAQIPSDLRNTQARGLVMLHGDRDGDVYWLDTQGRRTGPPIVRDTRWRWNAVHRINLERGYALGRFHLDTILNLGALMRFSDSESDFDSGPTLYGHRGQRLQPWEINAVMPYDNQPATPQGFINRIIDYVETLHRQFVHQDTPHPSRGRTEGGEDT